MKRVIDDFVNYAYPALKDATVHAAKVGAYIVLSAAIAVVASYIEGKSFDPAVFFIANTALAAARKAIEALRETATTSVPYDPGFPDP